MSGTICRQTAPFLSRFLMAVTDLPPYQDPILKFALQSDVICNFLCTNVDYSDQIIYKWQRYLFGFGRNLAMTYDTDESTKIHLTMRHVHDHILILGFLLRSSLEENKKLHKQFKNAYKSTKKAVE